MSVVISGKVAIATSAGTVTGRNDRIVVLQPSRDDFQVSYDGGTTFQTWEGDPDIATDYPGGIAATTDVNGNYSFTVPWTDDPTEILLPGGSASPPLKWNITDPNPTAGTLVFTGATPTAVVGATKSIAELITLPSPDTWTVSGTASFGLPVADERYISVGFTSVSTAGALTFPSLGTASWSFTYGVESDDNNQYTCRVDTTNKTDTGAPVLLSDLPPAGKTVIVHFHVRAA
jgi:hypothetical protein